MDFTQRENERSVWQVAINVMNAYENGDLKDQKLNQKQLLSAPEFKQHLLQPIHNLPKSFQVDVLEDVLAKHISLQEMKVSSVTFRSMEVIKKIFVHVTSSKNWKKLSKVCNRNLTQTVSLTEFQECSARSFP